MIYQFYNCGHNGDIFFSLPFIKYFMTNIKDAKISSFIYLHGMGKCLNQNIPNLQYEDINHIILPKNIHNISHSIDASQNKTLINTWIGSQDYKFISHNGEYIGCNLQNKVRMWNELYEKFGIEQISFDKIDDFLPTIDYRSSDSVCENIDNIDNFFSSHTISNRYKKIVYLSNGDVLSKQSENFSFNEIVDHLSNKYQNILFLVTNNCPVEKQNVIQTKNIIKKKGKDLLENSYISTFCDIIVGRASGCYCFALTKDNLLSNKTFITFNNLEKEGFLHKPISSNAKFVWSNNYIRSHLVQVIENEIVI